MNLGVTLGGNWRKTFLLHSFFRAIFSDSFQFYDTFLCIVNICSLLFLGEFLNQCFISSITHRARQSVKSGYDKLGDFFLCQNMVWFYFFFCEKLLFLRKCHPCNLSVASLTKYRVFLISFQAVFLWKCDGLSCGARAEIQIRILRLPLLLFSVFYPSVNFLLLYAICSFSLSCFLTCYFWFARDQTGIVRHLLRAKTLILSLHFADFGFRFCENANPANTKHSNIKTLYPSLNLLG